MRVNIGNTSGGDRRYLVCEVLGIRDKATDYQVPRTSRQARPVPRAPRARGTLASGPGAASG